MHLSYLLISLGGLKGLANEVSSPKPRPAAWPLGLVHDRWRFMEVFTQKSGPQRAQEFREFLGVLLTTYPVGLVFGLRFTYLVGVCLGEYFQLGCLIWGMLGQ